MSASRGLWLSALGIMMSSSVCLVAPSQAQIYDDPVTSQAPFYTDPNPLWRSPALVGMGQLVLADGHNNRLNLWDYARNIAGIYDSDSSTTIELRPGIGGGSAEHITPLTEPRARRQTLDARQVGVGYEMWRRTANKNAYGFYSDFLSTRTGVPYSDTEERAQAASIPGGTVAVNGRVPHLKSDRLRAAARVTYRRGKGTDDFHEFALNPTGAYLGRGGDAVPPPDQFVPTQYAISYLGAGGALSYRFGPWLTSAFSGDYVEQKLDGKNEDPRHKATTGETRPYGLGQATLLGQLGPNVQWIVDGKTWQAANQVYWVFTISGGISQPPLTGRGLLANRYEEGSALHSRARWLLGQVELGAQANTYYQRLRIGAPDATDLTSFNVFINALPNRQGTDSLVTPDSVLSHSTDQRNVDFGLGAFYRLKQERGRVGVETHWLRARTDRTVGGSTILKSTDVRTGLEYRVAPLLLGRAGYVFKSWDADDGLKQNEYITHTVTAGFGIMPPTSRWDVELGFALEWGAPDYDDPFQMTGRRQQLATQFKWSL